VHFACILNGEVAAGRRPALREFQMIFKLILVAALCAGFAGFSKDVDYYGIFKYRTFRQTGANPPLLDTNSPPYGFSASVQPFGAFQFQVSNAVLHATGERTETLSTPSSGSAAPFSWEVRDFDLDQLSHAFPPGDYSLSFDTRSSGPVSILLPLPADAFPSAPRIINVEEATDIDPSKPFVLRWEPVSGVGTNDLILFQSGKIRSANYPGEPGYVTLTGADTSFEIPANSLPSEAKNGKLISLAAERDTLVDRMSVLDAVGFVGFGSQTLFTIRTRIREDETLRTLRVGRTNDQLQLNWSNSLGPVQVQKRLNLRGSPWENFQAPTSDSSATDFISETGAFYRLQLLTP
jgi:hypothetical protein